MKRFLSLLLAVMLLCLSLPALAADTRSFTDDAGRVVEIPAAITKVAVTGPMAQYLVFAIAPDTLVGVASKWDKTAEGIIAPEYLSLPVLGHLYGGKGDLNLEELLNAAPEVVIDIGETKKGIAEDMDALSAQTGIPFIHIQADLTTYPQTFQRLGELLNRPEDANALTAYCTKAWDRANALADKVEKVNMLYVVGEEGLNVLARSSSHAIVVDLLCNNVAVVESPSGRGTGNEVSMEQILVWNPDYMIFSTKEAYEKATTDPMWQDIAAVQQGHLYQVPYGPLNWLGFPATVQLYLGMNWLSSLLYPDACDFDLYEETAAYFQLFYHADLTPEQFQGLTPNALAKP